MHAAATGRLIGGRYRLDGQLGQGAMGVVWRGRDELLDRDVAVKQIRLAAAGATGNDTAYQRTLREARTAARLSHPGLVTVFDVVEEDGAPWIVMELVPSRSLGQVIAEDGPLPPAEAARLGERLVSALACAHKAGVLHRDVKPSNVLMTPDGGAVLTDFGIATFAGDPGLTQAGMVVGTPSFTAPERVRGAAATPASDLWSLGATLFAAVEGRGPFDRAGGSAVIMAAVVSGPAPRAPSAGPLGPVIEALMRTDPAARPDAAQAGALLAAVAGPPASGEQAPTVPSGFPGQAGSADFAGLREFPDFTAAGAARSGDRPARLGLPAFADPLPAGQRSPWNHASSGGPPSRPPRPRHRTLIVVAGAAAVAAAAVAGWALSPRPASSAHSATGQPGIPAVAGTVGGGSKHGGGPGGQRGVPGSGGTVASDAGKTAGASQGGAAAAQGSGSQQASGTGGQPGGQGGGAAAPPLGYRWLTVTAAGAGSAAGFRIAVPVTWKVTSNGLVTYLDAAAGNAAIELSLTTFRYAQPLREAQYLQASAIARGTYPGYRRVSLTPGTFQGSPAASWRFNWRQGILGKVSELETLAAMPVPAGTQDYALTVSAPALGFPAARTVFNVVLRTFQPLP